MQPGNFTCSGTPGPQMVALSECIFQLQRIKVPRGVRGGMSPLLLKALTTHSRLLQPESLGISALHGWTREMSRTGMSITGLPAMEDLRGPLKPFCRVLFPDTTTFSPTGSDFPLAIISIWTSTTSRIRKLLGVRDTIGSHRGMCGIRGSCGEVQRFARLRRGRQFSDDRVLTSTS